MLLENKNLKYHWSKIILINISTRFTIKFPTKVNCKSKQKISKLSTGKQKNLIALKD